jgi:hypothetical protein
LAQEKATQRGRAPKGPRKARAITNTRKKPTEVTTGEGDMAEL